MNPLVSILIPAYNAERWISDAIGSALAQTWPDKEIIVVDDGSHDGTLDMARRFQSSQVKVVTQLNAGASAARNHALRLCQGDFIQWLDADDVLDCRKIEFQLIKGSLRDQPRTISTSAWGQFYRRPDKAVFVPCALWENLTPAEWLFRKLDQNLWMAIQSWLVSRHVADLAGSWNAQLLRDNDGEYFCRVVSAAERIEFIPEARSFVRQDNISSISQNRSLSVSKLHSLQQSLILHISYLRALEDTPRTRAAAIKLLQRWFIYFYPEHKEIVQQMEKLAVDLGGRLLIPKLKWRYSIFLFFFGWKWTKWVYFRLPKPKRTLQKTFEKYHLL